MKKPTPTEQRRIDRFTKSEFEKVYGPWPEGMTKNKVFQLLAELSEEKKALHAVNAKATGMLPSEIKKMDFNHDPDAYFFWGIGTDSNRDLKIEWVKDRLQEAIEQNDLKFFIRFGDALKKKPRQFAPDKMTFLLAAFWATPLGKTPPLSWFTDEALVEMLIILTGNESLTFPQIRKARQRLGLESKDVQINGVIRVGSKGFKLKWVDKAKK